MQWESQTQTWLRAAWQLQQLASITSSDKKLSSQTQHSPSSVLCLCIIFIYPHLTLTSGTPEEICSWLWFLFLSILPLSTHKISTLSILSSLYSKATLVQQIHYIHSGDSKSVFVLRVSLYTCWVELCVSRNSNVEVLAPQCLLIWK